MNQYQIHDFLNRGLRIGRISGIDIRLHFTMLLFLLCSPWIMNLPLLEALFFSAMVFGCVLLHELGHCYGARLVGGYARQVILWPLGGLALVEGAQKNPKAELIVIVLGPAVNVVLALLGWGGVWLCWHIPVHYYVFSLCYFLAEINTAMALFNLLLPLFPMDSARIIRAALSFYIHPNRATYYVCTLGMYLGGAVALYGLFFNQSFLTMIGIFGAMISYQERQRAQVMPVYDDESYFYSAGRQGLFEWIGSGLRKFWPRKRSKNKSGATIIDMKSSDYKGARSAGPVDELRREMSQAIAREDFQEAARLRDKIKSMQ